MLGRRLTALLISILAIGAGSQSASAAEPGVVPDLTYGISEADKLRTAEILEDAGSRWVRLNMQWAQVEPADGTYDEPLLSDFDRAIDIAREAGQRVIVMVDTAPVWASGSPDSNVPRDPEDYAEVMGYLADRYGDQVDAYEVWNEPNLDRFWNTGPDPAEYAALLKAAHPRIKAADPSAQVIFGGLSGNDYGFLEAAYANGVQGYFDVMATHPYPYCGTAGPAEIRRERDGRMSMDSFLGYREVRAAMEAQGDAKPIWFTEIGWNTSSAPCDPGTGMYQGGVSEETQARYVTEAFELIEADDYVEVALYYNLRNNYWQKDSDTPEARYGLLRTDFSPKPAFAAFQAYALGRTDPVRVSSALTDRIGGRRWILAGVLVLLFLALASGLYSRRRREILSGDVEQGH